MRAGPMKPVRRSRALAPYSLIGTKLVAEMFSERHANPLPFFISPLPIRIEQNRNPDFEMKNADHTFRSAISRTLPVFLCFSCTILVASAQNSNPSEKILDISPDQKFAMRISYEGEAPEGDDIQPESIKAIELVSLPSRRVVAQLLPKKEIGLHFDDMSLLWSADSKWCAFYHGTQKVAYTAVFKQGEDRFVPMSKPDKLTVPTKTKEGTKDKLVEPVRWIEPGVLVCKQLTVSSDGVEENYEFSVRFGSKPGKFSVISKKNADDQ